MSIRASILQSLKIPIAWILHQVIQVVLAVAVEYSNIIPIRFTNAQLAQVDEIAAQFKIKRSTLIREQSLRALSQSTEKTAS